MIVMLPGQELSSQTPGLTKATPSASSTALTLPRYLSCSPYVWRRARSTSPRSPNIPRRPGCFSRPAASPMTSTASSGTSPTARDLLKGLLCGAEGPMRQVCADLRADTQHERPHRAVHAHLKERSHALGRSAWRVAVLHAVSQRAQRRRSFPYPTAAAVTQPECAHGTLHRHREA